MTQTEFKDWRESSFSYDDVARMLESRNMTPTRKRVELVIWGFNMGSKATYEKLQKYVSGQGIQIRVNGDE